MFWGSVFVFQGWRWNLEQSRYSTVDYPFSPLLGDSKTNALLSYVFSSQRLFSKAWLKITKSQLESDGTCLQSQHSEGRGHLLIP